jgi:predicted N-acyltransferase
VLRTAQHIDEIGRKAWGVLQHESLVSDYDWLLTWEDTQLKQRKICYWWIEDGQGVKAAVVAFTRPADPPVRSVDTHRYGSLATPVRWLRKLLLVRQRPTLVCGAQSDPGNPILIRKGLGDTESLQAVSQLLDAIESHCKNHRLALVIRAVPESVPLLRSILEKRPYLEASTPPQSVLDIRWHSWREYLCDLKKNHPSTEKSVRMQVNRGRRSEIIIETLDDPCPYLEEIYAILAGHFQRKNHTPYLMAPEYLKVLKERLGDRALIHVARKDERIIGVSIYLRYGAVMHWVGFGIADDHVRSRNSVYFNLAFHFPIEQACLNGTERMIWGTTAYQAKCSRGARLKPVSNWIWQPRRLLAALQRLPLFYEAWRQKRNLGRFT